MADKLNPATSRFRIRPASKKDVPDITNVFFKSFNAPFWKYFIPNDASKQRWWNEAWSESVVVRFKAAWRELGLDNPTDRTFVVEDTEEDNKIVGFSRWMVPQQDGNQERKWPELSEDEFDMEVAGSFFGGMEENRSEMMGNRPHWMLELLGVHENYQRQGIGARLIDWGTQQADKEGLETYLDASEIGRPYYMKRHGFQMGKVVNISDRPQYGSYQYVSLSRPPHK